MGSRIITPQQEIERYLTEALEILHNEIMRALQFLCEQCVSRVRDRDEIDSWFDHTGNLRSSVGYGIFSYGEELFSSAFETVKGGSAGSEKGKQWIEELATQYQKAYSAVIIAAMNYADYVESLKNKDVLASTELWVRDKVDSYVQKAIDKAIEKINKLKQ